MTWKRRNRCKLTTFWVRFSKIPVINECTRMYCVVYRGVFGMQKYVCVFLINAGTVYSFSADASSQLGLLFCLSLTSK